MPGQGAKILCASQPPTPRQKKKQTKNRSNTVTNSVKTLFFFNKDFKNGPHQNKFFKNLKKISPISLKPLGIPSVGVTVWLSQ